MTENKIPKKFSYIILIITLITIMTCVIFDIFLFYGFLISIIFALILLNKVGFSTTELLDIVKRGINEYKSLFLLVALIGAMISIWMASGVVPTMLYLGLKYMQNTNFLLASFVLTSIIAIFMGSAFGTMSSIGITLLGLATIFGIPDYILLGAIVSGAFIADKASPLSSSIILTMETVKTNYRELLKSMLQTFLPTYILSAFTYYFIGRTFAISISTLEIENFISAINTNFIISPLLLLLPISIIVMSFLGVKMIKAMSLAIIAGAVVSVFLQGSNISDIIAAIISGYSVNTNSDQLNAILVSGGMLSMVPVILIIAGATSMSNLFQETNLMNPIIDRLTSRIKSKRKLIIKTGLISSILTIISDQSVGIILPGKLLSPKYKELEIDNSILARTIADTGIVITPLIPWNVNSLFILSTTGIASNRYAPFAVLCFLSPIITFIFAYIYELKNKVTETLNLY
ncbi:MAG: Na+/H+ antiporter NhaC family protein [Tissierellaceae bacterium]|nr:Na+/H+ antiporter NhaC family protein [Tissierellaceae bacterium]